MTIPFIACCILLRQKGFETEGLKVCRKLCFIFRLVQAFQRMECSAIQGNCLWLDFQECCHSVENT